MNAITTDLHISCEYNKASQPPLNRLELLMLIIDPPTIERRHRAVEEPLN